MEILTFPHQSLFQKTTPVKVFGEELKILLDLMYETMKTNNGIGLAANQVELPYSMFVMEGSNGRVNLVNPSIVAKSVLPANIREGCLSAPGEFVTLKERSLWVKVSYQDENGLRKTSTFKDVHSVCVQHEMEHLEGKSFMENKSLPKETRKQLAKKWKL